MSQVATKVVPCCVCGTMINVPMDFNPNETYCLKCYGMLKRKDIEFSAWFQYFKKMNSATPITSSENFPE